MGGAEKAAMVDRGGVGGRGGGAAPVDRPKGGGGVNWRGGRGVEGSGDAGRMMKIWGRAEGGGERS